jgi:uncharacterized membrane protein
MKRNGSLWIILLLAVMGTLFSGYLTYYTFANNKPGCDLYFFGLPSCFFGALMYAIIFISSLVVIADHAYRNKRTIAISIISAIGIAFATFLTLYILSFKTCTSLEILGIPPCVYGLLMYIAILLLAISSVSAAKHKPADGK